MSINVIAEMSARDDSAEAVAVLLKKSVPDTRAFEGCEEVKIYRNSKMPSKFVLVSKWVSNEALEKYAAWR